MWGTVLAIALVSTADPVRIGIAVLLFSRSRPVLHLVALWLGGMTVGVVLGMGVLFGLHDVALGVMQRVELAATSSTVGHIQIVAGVLALLVAVPIAVGFPARQHARVAIPGGDPSCQAAPSAFNLDRGPGIADRAIDHPLGRRPESGLEAEPATSDHYFQAENRVSHALLLALNEDRRLL